MPLIEGRPDALAQTYARSIVELAMSDGGRETAERYLGELEDILELARQNSSFAEFLSSRVLSTDKRRATLERIFANAIDQRLLNFLLVLNENGRLGHLPKIVAAIDAMVQKEFGRVEVDIYTAEPLPADEHNRVRDRLSQALGRDVVMHPYVDGRMIGGVRLQIGDQLIDGSVATQLKRMSEQFSERASDVRSRLDGLIEG